jgi:hypothetical protein
MKKGMKVKVPVQSCRGGGGMAGQVLPGDSEWGRGVLWQAKPRVKVACFPGV